MHEIQAYGQPPPEIMQELDPAIFSENGLFSNPDLSFNSEDMPKFNENSECIIM